MKALNIKNIIKKDIQNIQSLFLKNDNGKEMYSLITYLESMEYVIRIQVNSEQEVTGVFFLNEKAIREARLWPEAIIIDATYKTNAHKLSLVNIVGTSNTSIKGGNILQTFSVAAAFVNNETEQTYNWIMEELREAVWPADANYTLPSVMVTDNETALRNAIDNVFPEVQHLLCTWHLWNTMATKLPIGKIVTEEYDYWHTKAEVEFQKIMYCNNEVEYEKALDDFKEVISVSGRFKENGMIALNYLNNV